MGDPSELVVRYMRAGEQGDWETFAGALAEDFVFNAPPVTLNKRELLSTQKALWGAFPDLNFNLRITEVVGNIVKATYRLTGTHTGTLIPPVPGSFIAVAATRKKVALVESWVHYTLQNDTIIRQEVEPNPESGWPGVLKQLGVKNPYSSGG
jgi:hypothetical protein